MTSRVVELIPWHEWFAWYPVYDSKLELWAWLTTVKRRRVRHYPPSGLPLGPFSCWQYEKKRTVKNRLQVQETPQEDA